MEIRQLSVRPASLIIFSSLFVLGSCSLNREKRELKSKPNILLILSDDQSVPHVGCYGDSNIIRYNLTPNLDKFAAEGRRFERAYTTAPQCAPSRISMFTGRSPVDLGVTRFAEPARPEVLFFTDILRKNGYWTAIDGRNQHLEGKVSDLNHVEQALKDAGMKNLDSRFDHFVSHAKTKGVFLDSIPQKINAILNEIPADKPFFLYFGFNQPHRKFEGNHSDINPDSLILPPDWPDLPGVRGDYAKYLSDLKDLDRGFGSILKVLEDRGLEKNTIIIFMGDNGESLLRGKGTLYGRGLHVPLIIRWPGMVEAGSVSESLVSGQDIAPTLLDALAMDVPADMTGKSFFGDLSADSSYIGREYIFGERGWHPGGTLSQSSGLDFSRSITTEQYNFIYNALPNQEFGPVDMLDGKAWQEIKEAFSSGNLSSLHKTLYFQNPRPVFELYDLETDPYELNNLAGLKEYESIEEALKKELDMWMVKEHDFLPLPGHLIDSGEKE